MPTWVVLLNVWGVVNLRKWVSHIIAVLILRELKFLTTPLGRAHRCLSTSGSPLISQWSFTLDYPIRLINPKFALT